MKANEFKKKFDKIIQENRYVEVHFAQRGFIIAQDYFMYKYKGKISVDFHHRCDNKNKENLWTGTCYLKDIKKLV